MERGDRPREGIESVQRESQMGIGASATVLVTTAVRVGEYTELGTQAIYLLGRDVINYVLRLNVYDAERYGYQQGLLLRREVEQLGYSSLSLDLDEYDDILRYSMPLQFFIKGLREGFEAGAELVYNDS